MYKNRVQENFCLLSNWKKVKAAFKKEEKWFESASFVAKEFW